jgi:GT2 family glycosyltransferase
MRASIIVVSYNSRAYLGPCLDSILQELGPEDELIVVDNGSSDGSATFVEHHYPQVHLLRGPNTGYAGGNNRGAAIARGAYLCFFNPDTKLQPGALAALLKPLEAMGEIGLTTPCVVHMDWPGLVNTCGNIIHYTGLAYCRGAYQSITRFSVSSEVDAVSGAAFAIRREIFGALGGFDERFFMYVEDTDLSWRARLAGYRCLYVAKAIVAHDYRPSYSPSKAFYLDRNRHLMLMKNLSREAYVRMLPALLLAEVVTWGFLLLKGPRYWAVKSRVYRWLWKQRHTIRHARRVTYRPGGKPEREIIARMTYQLDFRQLASGPLVRLAAVMFHPTFWIARLLVAGGRP